MDDETFDRETARNRQAYELLREQIRRDCTGQYVALGLGQILAVAPTFDEAVVAVQQMKPVPDYFLIFPADEGPIFEPYYSY